MTPSRRLAYCLLVPVLAGLLVVPARAEDDDETWLVERVPFGESLTVEGRLIPRDTFEVRARVQTYKGELEIEESVGDGDTVSTGDLLVGFKLDGIERQIHKTRIELELAAIKHREQEEAFERGKTSLEITITEATRKLDRAQDDLQYYREVDLPMRKAEAEHRLQGTRNRIEDQKEELRQLEKMYGEDDLTEETEEIVMMRARRNLARSIKALEFAETRNARWLNSGIQRETENKVLAVDKARLEFDKIESEAKGRIRTLELGLEKSRMGVAALEKTLVGLQDDVKAMRIHAPDIGPGSVHVVAGSFKNGVSKGRSEAAAMLVPGKTVKNGTLLMTVFASGEAHLARVLVDETDVLRLNITLPCGITVNADKSTLLLGDVLHVQRIGNGGKHAVLIRLLTTDWDLVPGMACSVEILDKHGPSALVVAASAITQVDGQSTVYVWNGSGKPATPVAVVPGEAKVGLVSIDTGAVNPGRGVLLHPPRQD